MTSTVLSSVLNPVAIQETGTYACLHNRASRCSPHSSASSCPRCRCPSGTCPRLGAHGLGWGLRALPVLGQEAPGQQGRERSGHTASSARGRSGTEPGLSRLAGRSGWWAGVPVTIKPASDVKEGLGRGKRFLARGEDEGLNLAGEVLPALLGEEALGAWRSREARARGRRRGAGGRVRAADGCREP
jgi:hypothetical protein